MEQKEDPLHDPAYVKQKREELRVFFKDAKFSQAVIDTIIENELRPLKEHSSKPYIAASAPGEVKSEYEVMTGQPFTNVEGHTKPLTAEEIREMLKDSPILAEKARQIQIVKSGERNDISIPLDQIKLQGYNEMNNEIESARGDHEKLRSIHYKNMSDLVSSISDYDSTLAKNSDLAEPHLDESDNYEDALDQEYEAIEKEVSKYTNKSYDTRFQETKEMLSQLADSFEDGETFDCSIFLKPDHILKEASLVVIESNKGVDERDPANGQILFDKVGKPDSSKPKTEMDEKNVEQCTKSFKEKLRDTESALVDIDSILSRRQMAANAGSKTIETIEEISLEKVYDSEADDGEVNIEPIVTNRTNSGNPSALRFDERMEQTLHNALEGIFEMTDGENRENRAMEVNEMKNLAKNIVEGAENLSTIIREDITNKLNSMNELLNDVNEALDNSRKSSLEYERIKKEGEIALAARDNNCNSQEAKEKEEDLTEPPENAYSDPDLDEINAAIGKLNAEIKCHEERITKSENSYKERSKECKKFIADVDEVLLKSQQILHPKKLPVDLGQDDKKEIVEGTFGDSKAMEAIENKQSIRKELWDVDLDATGETSAQKLAKYKLQEEERSKRIDDLLHGIKDKMKDNKEVLRLANNLLRREESKTKALEQNKCKITELRSGIDENARGDCKAETGTDKDKKPSSPTPSDIPSEGQRVGELGNWF